MLDFQFLKLKILVTFNLYYLYYITAVLIENLMWCEIFFFLQPLFRRLKNTHVHKISNLYGGVFGQLCDIHTLFM